MQAAVGTETHTHTGILSESLSAKIRHFISGFDLLSYSADRQTDILTDVQKVLSILLVKGL